MTDPTKIPWGRAIWSKINLISHAFVNDQPEVRVENRSTGWLLRQSSGTFLVCALQHI